MQLTFINKLICYQNIEENREMSVKNPNLGLKNGSVKIRLRTSLYQRYLNLNDNYFESRDLQGYGFCKIWKKKSRCDILEVLQPISWAISQSTVFELRTIIKSSKSLMLKYDNSLILAMS